MTETHSMTLLTLRRAAMGAVVASLLLVPLGCSSGGASSGGDDVASPPADTSAGQDGATPVPATGSEAPAEGPTAAPLATANQTQEAVAQDFSFPRLGRQDAQVTIYEFSDYRCPYCHQWSEQTEKKLYDTYIANDGPVALVWVDFPLTAHGYPAVISAEAAHCAREEDKYWEMHDAIYTHFDEMNDLSLEDAGPSVDFLTNLAGDIGLDADKMRECLDTQRYRPVVSAVFKQARGEGVDVTPTFIIQPTGQADGAEIVLGAVGFDEMQPYIERGISRAQGTVIPTFTPEGGANETPDASSAGGSAP